MPAPREVQVLIEEAKSHIEKEQWTEATLALGVLLGLESQDEGDLMGVDYFIEEENRPTDRRKSRAGATESVFKKSFELVESLPMEATKFVDLRYGVIASQMLEVGTLLPRPDKTHVSSWASTGCETVTRS